MKCIVNNIDKYIYLAEFIHHYSFVFLLQGLVGVKSYDGNNVCLSIQGSQAAVSDTVREVFFIINCLITVLLNL